MSWPMFYVVIAETKTIFNDNIVINKKVHKI